ncbi:Lipase chaperone [Hahella chejuensis KCTC 2396]|uniref:Lipase chaperone n=1 Tax=Hahella chejuensis (strain KCTC 2396) TaxID=349521 RepID=Q2SEF7_HAHCH|nr:lipase chaperone family protein [Hahella chejuensis]ABC30967.1 Lipase chaperone [Hahella chejuensis KCTC 2396]
MKNLSLALCVAALAAAALLLLQPDVTESTVAAEANPEGSQSMGADTVNEPQPPRLSQSDAPTTTPAWNGANFARALAGTDIDGDLRVDENGLLIMDIQVKDFFDYFFLAVGERSPEEVIAEIQRRIYDKLPAQAAEQAMELLNDYISYQERIGELMAAPLAPTESQDYEYYASVMANTFEQLKSLRRQIFAPDVVDAFFGLDEAYSDYALAVMQVKADAQLSDSEKASQVEALRQKLPAQMRDAHRQAAQRENLTREARRMYREGYDADSVRQALRGQFSDEKAEKIIAYYQREETWRARLDDYQRRKQDIQAAARTDAETVAGLTQLRNSLFTSDELKLVESYDAIERKATRYEKP